MGKRKINAFNAGELSPYLYSRDDFEKYDSGCLKVENFIPLPYGGATRRPAIEFLGTTKFWGFIRYDEIVNDDTMTNYDQGFPVKMVPFVASVDAAYQLEFGETYIRIWKDGELLKQAGETLELGTPYLGSDLAGLRFCQSIDVLWIIHPTHAVSRISRIAGDEFKIEEEAFKYPPLRDENDEEISLWTSGTTGSVSLYSSVAFFDEDHVGAYFKMSSTRNLANQSATGNLAASGYSAEVIASNSNWSVETSGVWMGKVMLERKIGSGAWEEYLQVGDTSNVQNDAAAKRNYSIESDEPEPFNSRLRLHFILGAAAGTMSYELQMKSVDLDSLVRVTKYVSETEVVADVIGDFQDKEADYAAYSGLSGTIALGTTAKFASSVAYSEDVEDLAAVNAGITGVVGADFGGGVFWIVTNGTSNKKIYKVNAALDTLVATYDLATYFDTVYDIAYYDGHVYVTGRKPSESAYSRAKKFTDAGVFVETFAIGPVGTSPNALGIAFYDNAFYVTYDIPSGASGLYRYNTAFQFIGPANEEFRRYYPNDVTVIDGKIYVLNHTDGTLDLHDSSLRKTTSYDLSDVDDPQGIAWDGTNIWVIAADGNAYKYDIVEAGTYYQCVKAHTYNADFSAVAQNWARRDPVTEAWQEGAFSDYRGHPRAIALFENRLCYFGTATDKDTFWMSKIDNYTDFTVGSLDTDALKLTCGGGRLDEIRWAVPTKVLQIGTAAAEWVLTAVSDQKPVTPTEFSLKRQSSYGASNLGGILVNNAVLFPMRQGRKLREWIYQWDSNEPAADLSILAEHITKTGIKTMALQQQPDNILWIILNDNSLVGLTYERDQNVVGWHRQSNDAFTIEDVSVLPREGDEDEVWLVCVMDGIRYIGRMVNREWGTDIATEWQGSDLFVEYTNPGTTLTGLGHLEEKTVSVVADGVPLADKVVSGGSITLPASYGHVVVGLPFTATLAPMHFVLDYEFTGTTKGSRVSTHKANILFKDTYSAKAGQTEATAEPVRFASPDTLKTDYAQVYFGNASQFLQTCYIVQDEQMPCTVLSMVPVVEGGR
jgi:hypothetical protein